MTADSTNPTNAHKPGKFFKRILRVAAVALLVIVLAAIHAWSALAIYFANTIGGPPRYVLAGVYVIAVTTTALLIRPRRYGLLASLAGFLIVLAWYFSIKPTNAGDWTPDVAQLASVTIDGNRMTIHNVRNFQYRSDTDFTPRWEDRTYDLDKVQTVDMILNYWGSKAIAHGIVSFGFADGRYLAVSIETRKQKSQTYSTVQGFFRQYPLIYVVADERDVLRVRTDFRHEDVYIYRAKGTPAEARAVLLSYVESINSLVERPRFYNTLTSNCVTSIVPHAQAGRPSAHIGWQLLLSGYADRQAYENGAIDTDMPLAELEARCHINAAAIAADDDADFSKLIRVGLPVPQVK